ncbi:MAG: TonB-dependent receptor [Cellulophaga sp.]
MNKKLFRNYSIPSKVKTLASIAFLFLFLSVVQLYGNTIQEREISGKITDTNGISLPGVSIAIRGTTKGVQSDFEGNYSIKASTGQQLIFTYIGMKAINIIIDSSSTINIKMEESSENLDEVVVVAYGKQSKKSIVGSVVVVGEEIIKKQNATTITTAIQGSVPGVTMIASGGQPGANPTIRIRGIGSISGSASPLFIVDGAPYNGNINVFSADQIASITVLKDASSTALYGSRAANGVILITTKQGKRNTSPRVTIKSTVGLSNQAITPHKTLNTDQQFTASWEALRNTGLYVNGEDAATSANNATTGLLDFLRYNPYGPTVTEPVDSNGNLVSSTKLWETDWRDVFFNDSAIRKEHSLSVSGGSENTTIFLSANYLNQEGSIKTSNFERITTRLNLNTNVNKWFSAGLGVSYSTSKQNTPIQSGTSTESATNWAWKISSIYPLYQRDENGAIMLDALGNRISDYGSRASQAINGQRPFSPNQNAYSQLFVNDSKNTRDDITLNGNFKIAFSDNLNFTTRLSHTNFLYDSFGYYSSEFGSAVGTKGSVTQTRDAYITTNLTNSLNYSKNFGNHNIAASLMQEAYKYKNKNLSATGIGFLPNSKTLTNSTTPEDVSGYDVETRIESYLGRLTYNYKNKYFLEGSYRRDGTTRFSSENRWGNFFSVGGSWVISDEPFLENSEILNYFKLKASYGELGNSDGIGNFPYITSFLAGYNEGDQTGVLLAFPNDPNITWEKTASFNAGLDFGLFNSALKGTVEYYNRESIDLFYNVPTPASTGATSFTTNAGSLRNYGLEISLDSKNVSNKNFEWTSSFNISFGKNEILELTQKQFISGTKRWEVGKSLYEFYIREYAGVDIDTGEALWYADILDTEGEPTGERETTNDFGDATRYDTGKSSLPKFYGGFTNYLRFGNFDMNILLNYSFGSYIYDTSYASLMHSYGSAGTAASIDLLDRWQQPGDITNVPRLLNSNNNYNSTSDRFLFKNDYVRLKAVNIGYNLPTTALSNYGITGLRLFLQGDNLATFQSHKGIDPEQSLSGTTNQRALNQRTYSFGVNLEF